MANRPGTQVAIGNGQTVNADAAPHFLAARAHVARETGVVIAWTQGTRTWDEQFRLWDGYQKKLRGIKGYAHFNPAWHPDDPRANHMDGTAVDCGSGVGYLVTLVSQAAHRIFPLYGIEFDVPGEGWHAHFVRGVMPAGSDLTPIPDQSQEDDMFTPTDSRRLEFILNILAVDDSAAGGAGGMRHTLGKLYELQAAQANRFALVRQEGRPEVFLSVDRQELRWIKSEASLKDQRYTLHTLGSPIADAPEQVVANLDAFGTIIGDKPTGY